MNSVWIILLSSVLTVYASPACDQDAMLKECGMRMDNEDIFPVDAFALKKVCSVEKKRFSCLADFLEGCPEIVKQGFTDFYIAAGKFVNRICDGDLRDKYLRNAKCFRDVITDKKNFCAQKVDVNIDISKSFSAVEDCIASFVEDTCGKEAVAVLLELYKVTRLMKDLYEARF